jgi:tetratricopeptide (TPR) repeat protein
LYTRYSEGKKLAQRDKLEELMEAPGFRARLNEALKLIRNYGGSGLTDRVERSISFDFTALLDQIDSEFILGSASSQRFEDWDAAVRAYRSHFATFLYDGHYDAFQATDDFRRRVFTAMLESAARLAGHYADSNCHTDLERLNRRLITLCETIDAEQDPRACQLLAQIDALTVRPGRPSQPPARTREETGMNEPEISELLSQAFQHLRVGEYDAASRALFVLSQLVESDDPVFASDIVKLDAHLHFELGHLDEAQALYGKLKSISRQLGKGGEVAHADYFIASIHMARAEAAILKKKKAQANGHYMEMAAALKSAEVGADWDLKTLDLAATHAHSAYVKARIDGVAANVAELESKLQARINALPTGLHFRRGVFYTNLGNIVYTSRDFGKSESHYFSAMREFKMGGHLRQVAVSQINIACAQCDQGKWDAAFGFWMAAYEGYSALRLYDDIRGELLPYLHDHVEQAGRADLAANIERMSATITSAGSADLFREQLIDSLGFLVEGS